MARRARALPAAKVLLNQNEICVAHLVRRANGTAPFEEFLDCYRRHHAGISHDLLIIYKGFRSREALRPYEALMDGIPHKYSSVSDFGYDVRPYMKVARDYPYRYFVFLNSFSRMLLPGWLELLYRHVRRPNVGVVGATGSYQSHASDYETFKRVFPDYVRAYKRPALRIYRYLRYRLAMGKHFPPFPNYHIRTNGFMVSRDVFAQLKTPTVLHKWDAYRFESSKASMTHQVISLGLIPLVVGADGHGYEPQEWPNARTFWISRQENLIVSDNQTRAYDQGSEAVREKLAFHAWRRYPDGRPRIDLPTLPNVRPSADTSSKRKPIGRLT